MKSRSISVVRLQSNSRLIAFVAVRLVFNSSCGRSMRCACCSNRFNFVESKCCRECG